MFFCNFCPVLVLKLFDASVDPCLFWAPPRYDAADERKSRWALGHGTSGTFGSDQQRLDRLRVTWKRGTKGIGGFWVVILVFFFFFFFLKFFF